MGLYSKLIDRQPVALGKFYSAHAERLEEEIKQMVKEARSAVSINLPDNDKLRALIAPHAGYVFSGTVSASAFMLLKDIKPRKKVFLIGSSHHTDFDGSSIYSIGDYMTPFGKVKVAKELATELIGQSSIFEFVQAAHAHEHSLEVMLPFIQYYWQNNFELVPIIIATHRIDTCKKIAEELLPWFTSDNLFVISTDLSHYPSYNDAVQIDNQTVRAVLSGKAERLIEQIEKNKNQHIPNLATSMCGWTSVLTLLYILEEAENSAIFPILYKNSGDAGSFAEKDRVVGYQSLAVYSKNNVDNEKFNLSERDKKDMLQVARDSIQHYIQHGEKFKPDSLNFSDNLQKPCGAFVSIYLNGALKGCIGRMNPGTSPLVDIIADVAVSSAFYDNRFTPLKKHEINNLEIEISVLTPLKNIKSVDEIELGKHGIYIKKGIHTGTFLPQVANETNWTKEEFLGHCSKNKAGIGWDGWKDAELFTYEAIVIRG